MLAPKSKWAEVFTAFDAARWRTRRLEERENRIFGRGVFYLILGVFLLGLIALLLHAVRS